MPAILFGSISTVADTSELQRHAFNEAFAAHGLSWSWGRDEYLAMLERSGGRDRIAAYAGDRGETVDADAVHATKSATFRASLAEAGLEPRPGVVDTIRAAREHGQKVALVTTTSPDNVAALLEALAPAVRTEDFDVIVDSSRVGTPKPDGAAYTYALREVGGEGSDAVAVEDNVDGVRAARAAGVVCVAFPNRNTAGHDFAAAGDRVEHLTFEHLQGLAAR